jgi:hypothetical protein
MEISERIRLAEQAIDTSIAWARAEGFAIICDAFVHEVPATGQTGYCALAALNASKHQGDILDFRGNPDAASSAWDAVEHGFDGVPWPRVRMRVGLPGETFPWWELGYRLRVRHKPISVAQG